ncbi:MAG: stage III sporulation protein AD [Lachnospiraceae bacterium]|nr:stage III sporulation protein AD [Lachnospiraceae bacterium]
MIYVSVFAVVGVLLASFVKNIKAEFATLIIIFVSSVIMTYIISEISDYFDTVNRIIEQTQVNRSYINILLKITGIAYLAEFSADLCKDAGYGSVANQIQIFGKVTILIIGLPIIEAVFNLMGELM